MDSNFTNKNVNLKALEKKAFNYRWAEQAKGIIPLTAADPDFPASSKIKDAISKYIEDGYFSYGPAEGIAEFKYAISNWYKRKHQVDSSPNAILPVNSAAYALFVVMKTILKPGDNAIIPNPVDFLFRKSIENANGVAVPCAIDKQTACFDLEELENKINSKTKAIMVCNPNNPLGKSIPLSHINDLKSLAKKHNLWLVSDEIWADIYYTPSSPILSLNNRQTTVYDKTIIVSGLSKNFALAGLRIGYIICPDEKTYKTILDNSMHSTTAFGLSPIAQAAGLSALTECDNWLDEFKIHLNQMRLLTMDFIQNSEFLIPTNTDSTYLMFPKIKNQKSKETVDLILKESKVSLVPGGVNWFESESEGHLRICYASSSEILNEAFDRILDKKELYF